ncbi:hypothetical protein IMCC13023_11050 [Candidatus Aquiluna sp. IMCC13023]|nr:hypothetical protein IMCC13023_11050 [Candidatus Aquiluna sp. IMCC13023]
MAGKLRSTDPAPLGLTANIDAKTRIFYATYCRATLTSIERLWG